MPFETLEQAQAEILRLEGVNTELTTERDALSQENETLKNSLEEARTINQKLFLERKATESTDDKDDEPDDVPTCEDFASTLTFN